MSSNIEGPRWIIWENPCHAHHLRTSSIAHHFQSAAANDDHDDGGGGGNEVL